MHSGDVVGGAGTSRRGWGVRTHCGDEAIGGEGHGGVYFSLARAGRRSHGWIFTGTCLGQIAHVLEEESEGVKLR